MRVRAASTCTTRGNICTNGQRTSGAAYPWAPNSETSTPSRSPPQTAAHLHQILANLPQVEARGAQRAQARVGGMQRLGSSLGGCSTATHRSDEMNRPLRFLQSGANRTGGKRATTEDGLAHLQASSAQAAPPSRRSPSHQRRSRRLQFVCGSGSGLCCFGRRGSLRWAAVAQRHPRRVQAQAEAHGTAAQADTAVAAAGAPDAPKRKKGQHTR